MKKTVLFISSIMLIAIIGFGKNINILEAETVASNFYLQKHKQGNHKAIDLAIIEITAFGSIADPDFYAITFKTGGFVIVSGIDDIFPVIGYSLQNNFSKEDQPEHYKNFLQGYSDKINYIRENGIVQDKNIKDAWDYYSSGELEPKAPFNTKETLEPIVPCQWNQGSPYNILCPEDSDGPGGHVYAGCVATAMSQIMYYWRYPLQGIGSYSYYYGSYGTISANFGATEYQWDVMEHSVDHTNPYPIAELQFHCGVAVDMMYGPGGSGAYSTDVPPALINYFGYAPEAVFQWKDSFSNTEWINKLKGNLNDGFPMYYSGYSSAGGHAFVCDGYQDDFFHSNFGWGGNSDGYYSLESVNGFSDGQGAVFDVYPGSNYPYYFSGDKIITDKRGTFEDGSGPIENYQENNESSWLISPQTIDDSISSITITFSRFDVAMNDYLIIYDGPSANDEILATLTGSGVPGSITSTGNEMFIKFITDGSETSTGWLAYFKSEIPEFCNSVSTFTEQSAIISDGSGSFKYHNSSGCVWEIIPENAETVTIEFTEFDTEPDFDYIKIFDYESQELLAEYSGHYTSGNLPPPVTSYSGEMFVAFSSNGDINFEGWTASYNTLPLGIEVFSNNKHFVNIYPNPANHLINIDFTQKSETKTQIHLKNTEGKIVYSMDIQNINNNYVQTIDISDMAAGIYFLSVISDKAIIREKIIVK